jgi:hypothetical protein
MSALDASSPHSLTEDYVGLARYLAQAIELGEVPFDRASVELASTVTESERASLRRAAGAARDAEDGDVAAELLARAQAGGT